MIYISHRLDELPRIADRVTVLRDGHYVGTHPIAAVDRNELIRLMVGPSLDAVFLETAATNGDLVPEVPPGCRQLRLRDVSSTVRAGEILGLAGLVGAGRTELAHVLSVGMPPTAATSQRAGRWRSKPGGVPGNAESPMFPKIVAGTE